VKRFLEGLGFEAKGEVCGCDVVALGDGMPAAVVIAELKLAFTLDLVLQAVDRFPACDEAWLAVRASRRGRGRESDPRVKKLCRLLGFGLLAVSTRGNVEVIVEPTPLAAAARSEAPLADCRGAPEAQGRSDRWWQYTASDYDCLSAASARLCQSAGISSWASSRSEGDDARCAQDPAAQRLWLV
jgi:hypothetical protein